VQELVHSDVERVPGIREDRGQLRLFLQLVGAPGQAREIRKKFHRREGETGYLTQKQGLHQGEREDFCLVQPERH